MLVAWISALVPNSSFFFSPFSSDQDDTGIQNARLMWLEMSPRVTPNVTITVCIVSAHCYRDKCNLSSRWWSATEFVILFGRGVFHPADYVQRLLFASWLHGERDTTVLLKAAPACRRAYLTGFAVTDDLELTFRNVRRNQSGAHSIGTLDAESKVEFD